MAVRAGAAACATSNIAVAIPCHRGTQRRFALWLRASVERKRALIDREAVPA